MRLLFTTIQNNLVKKSHILFCMQTLLLPISIKFVEYFSLTSILTFNFLLNFIHKTFKLTKTEVNTKYTTNLPNYERFTNNKCSCVRLYEWSFFLLYPKYLQTNSTYQLCHQYLQSRCSFTPLSVRRLE